MVANSTITKTEIQEIYNSCEKDANITFIDQNGEKHEMVRGDDYIWHSGITKEEYLTYNNPEQLEHCQKCTMWKYCSQSEYTTFTQNDLSDKMVDEITKEVNDKIVEQISNTKPELINDSDIDIAYMNKPKQFLPDSYFQSCELLNSLS